MRTRDGICIRAANAQDAARIQEIHRHGVQDLTGEEDVSSYLPNDRLAWLAVHGEDEPVLVAADGEDVIGWASLNSYSTRPAYKAVKELSIHIARTHRGRGIGRRLLAQLIDRAVAQGVRKVVLTAFPWNANGLHLYRSLGWRHVGTYEAHGVVRGQLVDVVIMEKILTPAVVA